MYHALLTRRYLTSKVMPLLAVLAVTLCTAMVLITWSVMGGFLRMFLESGKAMMGDVEITSPLPRGLTYYDELIERLEADPMVGAATPVLETFGMLRLSLLPNARSVLVQGVDPAGYDRVTGYRQTLWWKPMTEPLPRDAERGDPRLNPDAAPLLQGLYDAGLTLQAPADGRSRGLKPAIVLGLEVGGYYERHPGGYVTPLYPEAFQPGAPAVLSVFPMDPQGRLHSDQLTQDFEIVNNVRSGLFEVDARSVIVPLPTLQRLMRLDAARVAARSRGAAPITRVDPRTGREEFVLPAERTVEEPARVTQVMVRAKPGVTAQALRDRCEEIYRAFAADLRDRHSPPGALGLGVRVNTWEQREGVATLIAAVKKETALVLFLFGIISLTAVFLVLAIFWSMVSEKTRDVGILRAIGASRGGVAWLWVRYGLAIGLLGAALGGAASYLIVLNINPIHDWLGRNMGLVIWDPKVYYFFTIPSRVEPDKAAIVLIGGVLSSVVGALLPALKAARMDPVRALRFE